MQTTEQTTQTGFTLIELLIAVAIVALLAAIAVPASTDYVEKAKRSDATTGLTKIAAELERCYTQFSRYNDAGCAFGFVSDGVGGDVTHADLVAGIPSEEGDYTFTIGAAAGSTAAQSYVLVATAIGRQAGDEACETFTLTHRGQKTSTPAPAAGAANPCW